MTKSRGILPPRKAWTTDDDDAIRRLYPDTLARDLASAIGRTEKAVHSRAKKLGVRKSAAFLSGPMAQRLDGHRGNGKRFQKGNTPWCAGTKGLVGTQEGCRATQFKKGTLVGRNAARFIDVGGYRVNSEGYLDMKLRNDGPPQDRWERVHRLVWIEANGPIPDGHCVVFKPGMKTVVLEEITTDRLECVTRAEHARRNAWHSTLPPDLKELMGARIALSRAINRKQKELEHGNE